MQRDIYMEYAYEMIGCAKLLTCKCRTKMTHGMPFSPELLDMHVMVTFLSV